MSHRILIIDDDLNLLELLRMQLERAGFAAFTAASASQGLQRLRDARPDIILLDIMMPDVDGWTAFKLIRKLCDTPVIVLTARANPADKARALELGVDDYLTKPYEFEELTERIRGVLNHGQNCTNDGGHLVFDDGTLRVDIRDGTVARLQETLELSLTELRLLMYLASRRGQTIPYKELLVKVWGPEYVDQERYLHAYINHLCKKIEPDPRHPRYIRAHHKRGYSFCRVSSPTEG